MFQTKHSLRGKAYKFQESDQALAWATAEQAKSREAKQTDSRIGPASDTDLTKLREGEKKKVLFKDISYPTLSWTVRGHVLMIWHILGVLDFLLSLSKLSICLSLYFNQGCGVGRFFRIPTPDSDSSSFEKPTPTPAVLKNQLRLPTPAFLKTRLRLQQFKKNDSDSS